MKAKQGKVGLLKVPIVIKIPTSMELMNCVDPFTRSFTGVLRVGVTNNIRNLGRIVWQTTTKSKANIITSGVLLSVLVRQPRHMKDD